MAKDIQIRAKVTLGAKHFPGEMPRNGMLTVGETHQVSQALADKLVAAGYVELVSGAKITKAGAKLAEAESVLAEAQAEVHKAKKAVDLETRDLALKAQADAAETVAEAAKAVPAARAAHVVPPTHKK